MERWIDYKNARCHYRVYGKGKALMLVHGFIEDGGMWDGPVNTLKQNYRVIVPDLPGFGKSPLTANELSMDWYADYVYEIARAENVKKMVLLGHSMGGYITLNFAEKHSEMLAGFGLVNSHCFEDTPMKKQNRLKGIEFIRQHGTGLFVRELYYNIFHPNFIRKNKKLIDLLIDRAQQYTAGAVIKANTAMMQRSDKSEVLKTAKVPVLFINGSEDESAPLAYTLKQASYPANADFNLFEHCKHMSVFERKSEVVKIINAFCQRALG